MFKTFQINFDRVKNRAKEKKKKKKWSAYFGSCLILPVTLTQLPHRKASVPEHSFMCIWFSGEFGLFSGLFPLL